jgi:hypothetical protein
MTEKYTIKDVVENQSVILKLLEVVIRQRVSNKEEKLMAEVKKRGRMVVREVVSYLGISRQHSLTLMKNVSEHPGFSFRIGNSERKVSSILTFDNSKMIQDEMNIITGFIEKKGEMRLADMMNTFNVDIENAKNLAQNFLAIKKEYEMKETKIVKKNQSKI